MQRIYLKLKQKLYTRLLKGNGIHFKNITYLERAYSYIWNVLSKANKEFCKLPKRVRYKNYETSSLIKVPLANYPIFYWLTVESSLDIGLNPVTNRGVRRVPPFMGFGGPT